MIKIDIPNANRIVQTFEVLPRELKRATVSGINKTITDVRKELTDDIATPTGIKKRIVRGGLRVKRAQQKRQVATIRPISAGIPVAQYRYAVERKPENPTRGRIWVGWPRGRKLAAGFVNPLARIGNTGPVRTRIGKRLLRRPIPALGPSVATLWKSITFDDTMRRAGPKLARYIMSALQTQIGKRK